MGLGISAWLPDFGPGGLVPGAPREVCDLCASIPACNFGFRMSGEGSALALGKLAFGAQVCAFGATFIVSGPGHRYGAWDLAFGAQGLGLGSGFGGLGFVEGFLGHGPSSLVFAAPRQVYDFGVSIPACDFAGFGFRTSGLGIGPRA